MPTSDFLPFATQINANVISQTIYQDSPWVPVGFVAGIAQSAQLNKVWRQSSFVVASLMALIPKILDEDTFDDGNRPNTSDQIERLIGYTARLYAQVKEAPLDGRVYGRQSCPPCEYPAGDAGWTAVPPEAPGDTWYVRTAGTWGNLYNILLSWEFIQDVQGTSWYARTHGSWGDLPGWLLPAWGYFTDAPGGSWFVRTAGTWGDLFGYLLPAYGYFTDAPAGAWYVRTAGAWGDINGFGFATQGWVAGQGFATAAWVAANFAPLTPGGGGGLTDATAVWIANGFLNSGNADYSGNHEPYGRLAGWAIRATMNFNGNDVPVFLTYNVGAFGNASGYYGGRWGDPAPSGANPTWPPNRYVWMQLDPEFGAGMNAPAWIEVYPDGSWTKFGPAMGFGSWEALTGGGPGSVPIGLTDPFSPW